jgi:DNA-binding GntR family transcriptional regulator
MPPFERPGLVRDEVYEHLKREILSGRLEWGERVAEVEIALHLGVSRTPVREAVQRLAQDGLLELVPNRGARVRTVTMQEVEDAYAVREVLDGLAARLAAQHAQAADISAARASLERLEGADPHDYATQTDADRAFHHAIASASKNTQLVAVLRTLDQGVARVKLLTREYNQSEQTRQAHHAVLDAISAGDPEAASLAASRHVRDFRAIILSRLAGALAGRP